MNELLIRWFEIGFNILYLAAVWYLVIQMGRSLESVDPKNRKAAGLVRLAFILLAAGDTGHVGLRVLAYALGGLDAQVDILGSPMSLIGLGMLSTSVTVTLFYMILVYIWQARNNRPANWLTSLLQFAGVLRLIILALPGNDWGAALPPQPMSLYRNLPLMVQGLGVIGLFLSSAYRSHDTTFKWVGWMIAVSFAFYTPVILFARQIPLLGLLMIPKTCAYLVVAIFAYRGLWKRQASVPQMQTTNTTVNKAA